jgi:hypothetical protein
VEVLSGQRSLRYIRLVKATLSKAEIEAFDAALEEYGFSSEPGGSQDGNNEAVEGYHLLSATFSAARPDSEVEIGDDELVVLRAAVAEFAFSTEPGGGNEGDMQSEQLACLERLIGRIEQGPEPELESFEAAPRERLSDLAERSQSLDVSL